MESISSAFSNMKGASPQEKKEAIKRQVSSEIAMANVSSSYPPMSRCCEHDRQVRTVYQS